MRDWRGRKCQEKDLTGFAQWGAKKGWSKNLLSSLSKEIETSPSALETPDKKSETPLYLFSSHTWIFLCFLPASHLTRSLQRRPAPKGTQPHWGSTYKSVFQAPRKICIFNIPSTTEDFKGTRGHLNDLKVKGPRNSCFFNSKALSMHTTLPILALSCTLWKKAAQHHSVWRVQRYAANFY